MHEMLRQTHTRCCPQRLIGLAEEAVERHRVEHFRRMQLEQLGNLPIASGDTARSASCTMCSAGSVTARLSGYFGNSARMRFRISSVNTAI